MTAQKKNPKWLTPQVMVLRSELRLRYRNDETTFLKAYPQVRHLGFKPRNYILTGRIFK